MLRRKLSSVVVAVALGFGVVAAQVPSADALAVYQNGTTGKVKVLSGDSAYYYNYLAGVTLCLGDMRPGAKNGGAWTTQAKAYIGGATALGPRWGAEVGPPGSTVSLSANSVSNLTYGWSCLAWSL